MKVRFLKYNQIDKYKWDETIKSSYNKMVYAFSWYLDIVCPKWSALVSEDYQYVMPVPLTRKFFFKVSLQPYFSQQLGIFSARKITTEVMNGFFEVLRKNFSYVELNMNKVVRLKNTGYNFRENITYELDLIQSYEQLRKSYNENTKRNLKKVEKAGLEISKHISTSTFMDFFKQNVDTQLNGILDEQHYSKISRILKLHKFPDFSPLFYGSWKNGQLISVAFFIKTVERIYYLFGISNLQGKETMSMFGIMDHIIRKFSGKNLILDFEGSNIESIARMYHGFGAKSYTYDTLIINQLPFFLKNINRK